MKTEYRKSDDLDVWRRRKFMAAAVALVGAFCGLAPAAAQAQQRRGTNSNTTNISRTRKTTVTTTSRQRLAPGAQKSLIKNEGPEPVQANLPPEPKKK